MTPVTSHPDLTPSPAAKHVLEAEDLAVEATRLARRALTPGDAARAGAMASAATARALMAAVVLLEPLSHPLVTVESLEPIEGAGVLDLIDGGARLGLASTRQLLEEVAARLDPYGDLDVDDPDGMAAAPRDVPPGNAFLGAACRAALDELDPDTLNYRTVDGDG